MAVSTLNMPSFPSFDTDDVTTIATRWTKYKKRFQNLCVALNITEDKQKLALLLNYVGEEVYDIYDSLLVPGTDETYANAITLFDTHFNPKTNTSYEIYIFRSMKQREDENIQQYFIRLKQQAQKCSFGVNTETEIKRQLEHSTTSNKLRRYSFRNPTQTLTQFLVYAKTLEDTNAQAVAVERSEIQVKEEVEDTEVNRISHRRRQFIPGKNNTFSSPSKPRADKSCYRCGGPYPHPDGHNCPAINKQCNQCHKPGHFANVCRSKNFYRSPNHNPVRQNFARDNRPNFARDHRPLNQIEAESSEEESNTAPLYTVSSENSLQAPVLAINKFNVSVKIEKVPVNVLIDSGSAINILNLSTFNAINRQSDKKLVIRETDTQIMTYASTSPLVKVKGVTTVILETDKKYYTSDFYVVDTKHRNILSGESALHLNLITLPVNKITKIEKDQKLDHVPTRLQTLIQQYSDTLFSGNIGKITDFDVKLHIDKNIKPVAQPERRIPFALRDKVKKEIEKLEQLDIIEDVTGKPTPWLSQLVVVPKSQNDIRLCLDMRNANTAITRTRYPTPTVDDILVKLKDATRFTKLDMNAAFHQLVLSEDSRYITAFQTEDRIKRFKRLLFGATSASEELQHALRTILTDLPGVINIADDILIFGKTTFEHDINLSNVLKRLAEKCITLNLQKCIFDKENIDFYGFTFNSEGMKPSPSKIEALQNVNRPSDQKSIQSFLGLSNYLKRFIPNYSSITHPLRNLLKHEVEFIWTEQCEKSFQTLRHSLTSDSCITYFDNDKETFVYCDASKVGISSILLQKSPGKEDAKVISYSSRALTKTEQNYSQIERECLSIKYACERNRLYLLGRSFDIYNDHKPIVNLLNKPLSKLPLRIENMLLSIQGYNFKLYYVPTQKNISDYNSRNPHDTPNNSSKGNEKYVNFISSFALPNAITIEQLKTETKKDNFLQCLIQIIKTGKWYILNEPEKHNCLKGINIENLKHFSRFKNELTFNAECDILLKGNRLVLPTSLHKIAVMLAHAGHQGITKTKALMRLKAYFIGMDNLIEERIKDCIACQSNTCNKTKEPLINSPTPPYVWHTVHVDFLGPLPNGYYILVFMDAKSKFPEIGFLKGTTANAVIDIFEKTFTTFGYPQKIVSDNGPPFKSYKIRKYMKHKGIKHRRITPYWPQANGQVERFMSPLAKIIRAAKIEQKDWKSECYNFILSYRTTPHSVTNIPPADMMFNRKIRTTIPDYKTEVNSTNRKFNNFKIGDHVLVKQQYQNKLTSKFTPDPYIITAKKYSMITATNPHTNHTVTRNSSHFKAFSKHAGIPFHPVKEEDDDIDIEQQQAPHPIQPSTTTDITNTPRKQYPRRYRRPIQEWKKY